MIIYEKVRGRFGKCGVNSGKWEPERTRAGKKERNHFSGTQSGPHHYLSDIANTTKSESETTKFF